MFRVRYWVLLILVAFALPQVGFAQYEGDDVYDPFADYSEFEENSQEEADIHFFKNGRFFNAAFMLGWEQFTGEMGNHLAPNINPGLYLAYFFNLRFALQLSYTWAEHRLEIDTPTTNPIIGNVTYSAWAFHLKYYFNTQNVTRGLAALNPYVIGGFAQNYRTFALNNVPVIAKDDATSFDVGFGIEIPISDNQMYLGTQIIYGAVNFPTENQEFQDDQGNATGVFLEGDKVNAHFFLGINF